MVRLYTFISVLAFFIVWAIVAGLLDDVLFPGPVQVGQTLYEELFNGDMIYHVLVTLWRVSASFVIAMFVGTAIGLMMGRNAIANGLLDPWLVFFLNVPALVIIFLCYIWGGLTEFAAILAVVINKVPNVAVMLREGARSLSLELEEMATSFRFNGVQRYQHIILPQLQPFIAAAGRSGLSLIWKIVLVVEFLGRSDGVGFQLHTFFNLSDVPAIFAYSIAFIAIMLLIELVLLQPWERYATRWRPISH